MSGSPANRPRVAASDERYQIFLATSIALALFLGFLLAVLLGIAGALQASWGLCGQALAQVHGTVQSLGFAGFVVVGMVYRLLPCFSGSPRRSPEAMLPSTRSCSPACCRAR